ncbi:hypothetical protein AK830_g3636 [Neonectria ditissima]|uniref:AB hydrolase-1 domain-containing protein n=1 Tax=Neonectria ditissima TaxID=78410 RepID=A0A0N8H7W9_9HYPO|nr:hypothetical protein AK830_g3636 [Neonectria ditissima]
MASEPSPAEAAAARYVADARFHKTFTLPATAEHDALTVSYADAGLAPDLGGSNASPPTVLFMPGMFASRYLAVGIHAIAETLGVRVVVVDRPGMGKSTDVPLHQRVPVWIELVPQLLDHLGIKHVSLASHSAGTIYLMNTLYHHRALLRPDKPFVAFLSPWTDPSHSQVLAMKMLQYIPVSAFSVWNLIPKFFVSTAGPVLASSGAAVTKFSNALSSGSQDTSELEQNRQTVTLRYGLSREEQMAIEALVFKEMFEENTAGANSEALQCLRKGKDWSWGKCEDCGVFVRELVNLERSRRGAGESADGIAKLKVSTYFAESDALSGKQGQAYIEQCWKGTDDDGFVDVLDFETQTVFGADHDSTMRAVAVLEKVFVDAGGVMPID